MDKDYVLSIDLGTTGNRVIVFDRNAQIIAKEYSEFTQIYPKPGWVEHDAEEIWECTKKLLEKAISKSGAEKIAAIGITNQRETIVCWDKEAGKPLHNAIVWQDCRTQDYCTELKQDKELESYIIKNTGLRIDPYFSGTKAKWLLDNAAKGKKDALLGTIDSWIVFKLTGKHVTDHTNASRTMMYNIHSGKWDSRLMNLFGASEEMLPRIVDSSGRIGYYDFNGTQIPVSGIAGDQQAALFGQRCFSEGEIKNTYGTGCFCLMNTGSRIVESKNGLITTVASSIKGERQFALEGSVFIAGAAVQWLRDGMKLIENAAETEAICSSVEDTHGAYFIPAFAGLGTPYWNKDVRGAIFGLSRGVRKEHIVRAAVESIAYQSMDLIEVMENEAGKIEALNADGGATKNKFLMQFQADMLEMKVSVAEIEETTALGAAFLAGLAEGFWKSKEEISRIQLGSWVYHPQMDAGKRNLLVSGWKKNISQLVK